MSLTTLAVPTAGAKPTPASGLMSLPGLVALGMLFTLIIVMPTIRQIWATGFYLDPDDAMRMAQARDWMNGQGWFDLTSARLDPPNGVFMHWTRIVDVPIAMLIRLFGLFAEPETAERLTRLTFPMLLLTALFVASARNGRLLVGPVGPLGAVMLTMFSSAAFGYFQPGRLDHDHVSIVLLVVMSGALLRALDPAAAGSALFAGLVIAFGLAVSLETLPFAIIGVAVLPFAWIVVGDAMRRNLALFAAGLASGLLAGFALVVGPSHYLDGACDTLSAAHMGAGLTGAALCLALAGVGFLRTLPQRFCAAMAAGAATILVVRLTYPDCLADPYAGLDPLLRDIWLSRVSEARPLMLALSKRPALLYLLVLPILIGLSGALWAAWAERGVARGRWLALAALIAAGCAAGLWQVRALGEVSALSMFGALWIIARFARPSYEAGKAWSSVVVVVLALAMTPVGIGLTLPDDSKPEEAAEQKAEVACRVASAFTALANLPKGVLLAPIDTGGHFLARTPHGVVAAPYHRNVHGNKLAIQAFMSPPDQAEAIVRGSGARYLAFCPKINDIEMYREEAPQGLAAQLDSGFVPTWLKPLKLDSPYLVFEVN